MERVPPKVLPRERGLRQHVLSRDTDVPRDTKHRNAGKNAAAAASPRRHGTRQSCDTFIQQLRGSFKWETVLGSCYITAEKSSKRQGPSGCADGRENWQAGQRDGGCWSTEQRKVTKRGRVVASGEW